MSTHIKRYAPAYTISADQFEAGAALAGLHGGWSAVRSACLSYLVFGVSLEIAASTHELRPALVRDTLLRIDAALRLAATAAGVAVIPHGAHPMPDTGRANSVGFWDKMRLGIDGTR